MKKKLIFDLDNTLLFISDDWINTYQKFIDKYNLNISSYDLYNVIDDFEKAYQECIITKELCVSYINKYLNINIDLNMFNDLLDMYKDIDILNTDKVYRILDYLSKDYEIIGYSNWFTDNQIERLRRYNLDKFFNKVYGWDKLNTKPSKHALDIIVGNNNKDEYIFIGDNIEVDLNVPSEMGIRTIFFNYKGVEQNIFEEIHTLDELKDVL